MTQRKILARDLIFQVESATPGTWVAIGGINSATINLSENEEATDTTTYDSDGMYEQIITQRGAALELEGFFHEDHVTGVQDTGQLRCETLAAAVGYDSQGSIRFRHPLHTNWKVWPAATFSLSGQGGGNNAAKSWSCTVTRSGASTTAAVV